MFEKWINQLKENPGQSAISASIAGLWSSGLEASIERGIRRITQGQYSFGAFAWLILSVLLLGVGAIAVNGARAIGEKKEAANEDPA